VVEVLHSRDRRHELPPRKLLSDHAMHGSPHRDALFSGKLPRSPAEGRPQLTRMHAPRVSLRLGLVVLSVGRVKCRE
jgi:hypothetical protein